MLLHYITNAMLYEAVMCLPCAYIDTTEVHDNVVLPSGARPDLVHGAQGCLLNGESYPSFAIKPNIETEIGRKQKDVLRARVVKASLG